MNLYDRLRALLGLGDRRLRPKLGLSPDRRTGNGDRRDMLRSSSEGLADLDRLAKEKWKGETPKDGKS